LLGNSRLILCCKDGVREVQELGSQKPYSTNKDLLANNPGKAIVKRPPKTWYKDEVSRKRKARASVLYTR